MPKSFTPRIFIVFGIILALMLFFAQKNLQEDWDDLLESLSIYIDNFFYGLNPKRSPPVSTLEKETGLKSYVGEPFISFSKSDWDGFWNILYGVFPRDYPDNERLPPRVRQLTLPEMEEELRKRYPHPFSYFQDEHWQQFWQILFGKKAGRR
jgi:hypothetical protein